MASSCDTVLQGTHFVADLSDLISCTSSFEAAGQEYHETVCDAQKASQCHKESQDTTVTTGTDESSEEDKSIASCVCKAQCPSSQSPYAVEQPIGTFGQHALSKEISCGPRTTSNGERDDSFESVPSPVGITDDAPVKVKKGQITMIPYSMAAMLDGRVPDGQVEWAARCVTDGDSVTSVKYGDHRIVSGTGEVYTADVDGQCCCVVRTGGTSIASNGDAYSAVIIRERVEETDQVCVEVLKKCVEETSVWKDSDECEHESVQVCSKCVSACILAYRFWSVG